MHGGIVHTRVRLFRRWAGRCVDGRFRADTRSAQHVGEKAPGLRILRRPVDGGKRVAAVEILVNTPAAKTNIRAGTSHKLHSVIQGGARVGMQSLDAVLKRMVQSGGISAEDAFEHAIDKSAFEGQCVRQETV